MVRVGVGDEVDDSAGTAPGATPARKFDASGRVVSAIRSPSVSTVTGRVRSEPRLLPNDHTEWLPGPSAIRWTIERSSPSPTGVNRTRTLRSSGATYEPPCSSSRTIVIQVIGCSPSSETVTS